MPVNMEMFLSPVWLSLKIALLSGMLAFVFGVLAARLVHKRPFKGRTLLETVFMLPLVLPPTVIGFLLLLAFGRRSWIGRLAEWLWDQPVVFSWGAGVIAATVVAFPLVYQSAKTGFQTIDPDLEGAARSMGAGERQVLFHVTLPLAGPALATAFVLGFARALGEFGATIMIAGNIPGRTQTVPTAIYTAVDSGDYALAWCWTGAIVAFSFLLLLAGNFRKNPNAGNSAP
ncbi:molybdate ABC transporter permease subunit [Paenibacillus sp. GbtcB18]|uniref:molybdate ABC transporter permease subunit n=1 Tax=Paenibacillus sp. GbtcB18 TaxID=2824763 RepID=UPI001C2F2334|nr:molybdate ABC transporter permease subunit [Paenibacillus sp. GbtcB18]